MDKNYYSEFFCPHWGSESLPFEDFLSKVKQAGYDGVEMSLPLDATKKNRIVDAISNHQLKFIGQHWETTDSNFETHLANYKMQIYNLADAKPMFINSQTGKDYYTFDQNAALIRAATEVSHETGIRVIHETHRGKFSFAAHTTMEYLKKIPELELCLDISHWCCVAESLLDDQEAAVLLAIQRTRHIHSRVGFQEGPQVMDPRAPEWRPILNRHLEWWRQVIESNHYAGRDTTITTEFGPFPYLQHLPYTLKPIYDQWEVNVFMMNEIKNRILAISQ